MDIICANVTNYLCKMLTLWLLSQGDEVKVRNGKLYINGAKQDEPFTAEDAAYEFGPVSVPPGSVLVLGDNRNHSLDGKDELYDDL